MPVLMNEQAPNRNFENIADKPRCAFLFGKSTGSESIDFLRGGEMTHTSMGCFLIGVTGPGFSANGDALIGSVSDDPYDVRTFLRAVKPAGSQAHIGTELVSTTEHSLIERGYFSDPGETTRGLNESGLAFTCALIFEKETAERTPNATSFADLSRKMMTNCETVLDAIDLFRSAGACTPPFSVLLADAKGDLAHLEAGAFGVNVNHHYSQQSPGVVFAVNCYLSQKLVHYNAPNAVIENTQNNNLARRERGEQLAQELRGKLDVASLARILSDHANRERDPMDNPLLEAWGVFDLQSWNTASGDLSAREPALGDRERGDYATFGKVVLVCLRLGLRPTAGIR